MIDRSTYLKLPTKPFLLVLLKRVLCSRCGLSSDKHLTKNGKNELKLFLRGGYFLLYIFSVPPLSRYFNIVSRVCVRPSIVPFLSNSNLSPETIGTKDAKRIAVADALIIIIADLLIVNDFLVKLYKDTKSFLTFYKFEKFDRAWAKSFNSFLLPLKFIRSENVAMEHNYWLYAIIVAK
jgi:hypothetical protein